MLYLWELFFGMYYIFYEKFTNRSQSIAALVCNICLMSGRILVWANWSWNSLSIAWHLLNRYVNAWWHCCQYTVYSIIHLSGHLFGNQSPFLNWKWLTYPEIQLSRQSVWDRGCPYKWWSTVMWPSGTSEKTVSEITTYYK